MDDGHVFGGAGDEFFASLAWAWLISPATTAQETTENFILVGKAKWSYLKCGDKMQRGDP